METDEAAAKTAPPSTTETDVNMEDSENGVHEHVQMEIDSKVESPKKNEKKMNVPVLEVIYGGMAAVNVLKTVEKDFEMNLQDRVMEETKDTKNAVDAYVYCMRNKRNVKYHEFILDAEREHFISTLQEEEDWLYEDGGDENKGVYIAKLEELQNKVILLRTATRSMQGENP